MTKARRLDGALKKGERRLRSRDWPIRVTIGQLCDGLGFPRLGDELSVGIGEFTRGAAREDDVDTALKTQIPKLYAGPRAIGGCTPLKERRARARHRPVGSGRRDAGGCGALIARTHRPSAPSRYRAARAAR